MKYGLEIQKLDNQHMQKSIFKISDLKNEY
jgi:hypothetical protein